MAHSVEVRVLLVLNELTIFQLLARSMLGKRTFIISVMPFVHQFSNPLGRFAEWAARHRLAQPMEELAPDMPWMEGLPGRGVFNDIHHKVEAALHEKYPLRADRNRFGPEDLSYAMRKAVTDYTSAVIVMVLVIEWLEQARPFDWRLIGAPRHFFWIYLRYYGCVSAVTMPSVFWQPLINLYVATTNLLIGILWITRRCRFSVETATYILAVDAVSLVDLQLLEAVVQNPADGLVVHRNRMTATALAPQFRQYRNCLLSDTRVGLRACMQIAGQLVRDLAGLLWDHSEVDGSLFGRYCMLTVKRAMFRAFFINFRPRTFWCRDDYSMDHVVRSVELRRIAGHSFGTAHGLPIDTYNANWREVDYDTYYGFGTHLYENFYRAVWPDHMSFKAAGSFNISRDLRARSKANASRDIVFFPIVHPHAREIANEVFAVARAFGDRRVYVKFKPNRAKQHVVEFTELKAEAPPNVEFVDAHASPYELLLCTSYCIASGSTLAAESVQLGIKTFVFDVGDDFENFYFRNFPELAVRSGAEIVDRITSIESGTRDYDFSSLASLVVTADRDLFEIAKNDIIAASSAASRRRAA